MKTSIPFVKMVASGNDFVVIDNRSRSLRGKLRPFAEKICARHTGVGADGILLLEKSKKAKFRMRIMNSDGSEAEACGNGFRCIALYAKRFLKLGNEFRFESGSGPIHARLEGSQIQVQLATPSGLQLNRELLVMGHRLRYSFVNTGVPHVVVLVEGLQKIDVAALGRAIRMHPNFQPKGANVNFVEIKKKNEIQVRTYERGVEAETLACGTGSTASAIISTLLRYVKPTVRVRTRSGEILNINFKHKKNRVSQVTLQGQARIVYEGALPNGR